MSKRGKKINGQFIARLVEMQEAIAWRSLRGIDKQALERIELEHAWHGGMENGSLVVTFSDLEEWGLRRGSIAECIARLEALGFVECVDRGRPSKAEVKTPSRYRLTYLTGNKVPTHDWRGVKDEYDAGHRIAAAIKDLEQRSASLRRSLQKTRRKQKQNSGSDEEEAA